MQRRYSTQADLPSSCPVANWCPSATQRSLTKGKRVECQHSNDIYFLISQWLVNTCRLGCAAVGLTRPRKGHFMPVGSSICVRQRQCCHTISAEHTLLLVKSLRLSGSLVLSGTCISPQGMFYTFPQCLNQGT